MRLSRREEAWQTAEILILRHQLAVLKRRQPRRPNLGSADRALLATLLGAIPKARRQGCAYWSPRIRSCAGIASAQPYGLQAAGNRADQPRNRVFERHSVAWPEVADTRV
jgi:hypothetical protein